MRILVLGLQRRAVPAVGAQLVLAFVDGDLDTLDGRGRHVRVAPTQGVLVGRQFRVGLAHRVRV